MAERFGVTFNNSTDGREQYFSRLANLELKNLHDLCIELQNAYKTHIFDLGEKFRIILPKKLITELTIGFNETKNTNTYYYGNGFNLVSGSENTNDNNAPVIRQHEMISNEDVYTAFLQADLYAELSIYKTLVTAALINNNLNNSDLRENFIKDCDNGKYSSDAIKSLFTNFYTKYCKDAACSEDRIRNNIEFLSKFMLEPRWFYRAKSIYRADFAGNCILNTLGLVIASSGTVTKVANVILRHDELLRFRDEIRIENITADDCEDVPALTTPVKGGKNLIIYGAPGTGKSHHIEDHKDEFPNITRVVFHPEYTYFDFIGNYRPSPVYRETTNKIHYKNKADFIYGEPIIDYGFIPGPFTKVLVDCYQKPDELHTLVIEELNRADAAAVFGDVFQLLDREDDGTCKYAIAPSLEWREYLISKGLKSIFDDCGQITLPSNMNIIATMNSADQGVNPLDTAFKRRWQYMFMPIEYTDNALEVNIPYAGRTDVTWKNFIMQINLKLTKVFRMSEDRLIGPYFVNPKSLDTVNIDAEVNINAIKKVLFYLWDDVLRHENRDRMFGSNEKPIYTMSDLYKRFTKEDVLNILKKSTGSNDSDTPAEE